MTTFSDDHQPWKMPPPRRVLDAIETWRQLDLKRATDDVVRGELRSLLDSIEHFTVARVRTSGTQTVYRGRFVVRSGVQEAPWPWATHADLLYPPRGIAPRQRCNTPGEPVLYCAKDIITCLREMRPTPGDHVVIVGYRISNASLAVVVPKAKLDSLEGRPLFDDAGAISFLIFREFVRTEFTKPVGRGTEFLYKLSNAMCSILFDGPDNDGWIYPSVESLSHECLAFKPSFVDTDRLTIPYGVRFTVLGEQDRSFVVQRTHKATIHEDGVVWQPTQDHFKWIAEERRPGDPPLMWPLPG